MICNKVKRMKVSIIIPVYNEKRTILRLLEKVKAVKLNKEIIVIDDGSTDGSREILKRELEKKPKNFKLIFHSKNKGKGAAVKTGLRNVNGDVIIIQDADLEYNPQDYQKLLKPIEEGKAEVVYGSRFLGRSLKIFGKNPTPMPFHWIGNKFLTWLTNFLFRSSITDMETCYKVFTKRVARLLKLKSNRFDFEPEITAKILKRGYKILEIPIYQKPRSYKEGKKITWKDGIIALYTLLKYRFIE
jgi:glycosyltransferase involved in cell wall biosynthesis